jgi:general secretion pathway protein B
MSYILDALKKSEQERSRGRTPDLQSVHQRAALAPHTRRWWPYAVVATLLVNAGVLLAWLHPWKEDKNIVIQPANDSNVASTRPAVLPPKMPAAAQHSPAPAHKLLAAPPQSVAADNIAHAPAAPQPPAVKEPAIVNFTDLPADVRRNIPEMSFSVHLYSAKPTERMVSINGRMMKEGQEVSPGLKLEQITQDGMVFSYQEYKFKRSVF